MANDRLFLVHRPTGIACALGKRYLGPWFNAPTNMELERYYLTIDDRGNSKDVAIARESDAGFVYINRTVEGFPVVSINGFTNLDERGT